MGYTILDQRHVARGKHHSNRERLLRRARAILDAQVRDQLKKQDITHIGSADSRRITIRGSSMHEPTFRHSGRGVFEGILPGNKQFNPGDKIPIDHGGGSGGKEGSLEGDEDGADLVLTEEEYDDILFDGCELPDLVKKRVAVMTNMERVRAGIAREGPYTKIHIPRSLGNAMVRRKAATIPREKKIKALAAEREALIQALDEQAPAGDPRRMRIAEIEEEIARLRKRINAVPFFDPLDLRFKRTSLEPKPVVNAVMFCLLDVSASIGDEEIEIAILFFLMLYRFLNRKYEHVEVRFLQHTTEAVEVTQTDFFKHRRTGGTVVSTAYDLMLRIVKEHYPLDEWNIYASQCSDGENALDDMELAMERIVDVLDVTQYVAYAEINKRPEIASALWKGMSAIAPEYPHLAMRHLRTKADIYPVFRELFTKGG